MHIYLAGAISYYLESGERHKAHKWRDKMKRSLIDYDIYDPTSKEYFDWHGQGAVEANLEALKNSFCIVCNAENIEKSPGTIFELTYAFCNNIPVYWFGGAPKHPHIKRILGMNELGNVGEAVATIKYVYDGNDEDYGYEY